jgi:hypothetical protein
MPQTTVTTRLIGSTPMPLIHVNTRRLFQLMRDVITGVVGTSMDVSNQIVDGMELVFKNGVLLTPTVEYTVDADRLGITLGSAAIAGDYFVVWYYYRANR